MALITARPGRWQARPSPGISVRNKPSWRGSKLRKGISFGSKWSSIGRLVNDGRMPNWKVPRGLPANLQNEIVQEIENLLGRQSIADLDLEAVEMAARRQALRLAAHALEQRLNRDTSDHVGPQLPCPCGGAAKYHGRHEKTFESVLGALHLERAY